MAKKTIQPANSKPAQVKAASARKKVASGVSPHADLAAGTELARNALQRDRYEILLKAVFGLIIAIIVMTVVNVYLGTRPVEYRYFATTPEGKINELVALNRPVQSSNEVLTWASQVVTKAYSMSFANYAQQLDDIRPNFTDAGWRGYEQALSRVGFIDKLLAQQYVTTAVPQKAPVIVAEGLMPSGAYAWRLQMPIIVTFQSGSTSSSNSYTVETTIVRRSETENPKGLGIASIITN